VTDVARQVAARVAELVPGVAPRVGVILGSGLGGIADGVQGAAILPYEKLPGFPVGGVVGHAGRMVLGRLGGAAVAVMQGRVHLYEGRGQDNIKIFVRTLKRLGCEILIATNAAGGLRDDMPPGSVMMITDHINMMPANPLVGANDDAYGERFPTMENAYDADLAALMRGAAKRIGARLFEGVYVGCLGPSFETPAEIRAFARLGADAVGMSTVPEVIVARHCGMKVVALSVITNFAAGLAGDRYGHDQTLAEAGRAAMTVGKLIGAFLEDHARGR
jgi:xanthosine phosphorylase